MAEDANPPNTTAFLDSVKKSEDGDPELKAINAIVEALSALSQDQRLRALEYVSRRFSAPALSQAPLAPSFAGPVPLDFRSLQEPIQSQILGAQRVQDIRTLKEMKAPKSAIEMAVLTAYYVSEVAPDGERKKEITKPDVERYFKAAGFKLPADASFTLVNAKNAGYLDSAGTGQYKLNPVGYNLVAHRLGNRDSEKGAPTRGRKAPGKKRLPTSKKTSRTRK